MHLKRGQAGFTLIEIMVVLAIVAAMISIGASTLRTTSADMKAVVRKVSTLPKDLRSRARLQNVTYRLAINMQEEEQHTYWVEASSKPVLLLTEDQEEELARLTSSQREDEKPPDTFKAVTEPTRLPRGLYFDEVEFGSRNTAISSGVAYIHFFPSGLVEEAAIHLTDKKQLHWTLATHPLTGRTDIIPRAVSIKELRNQ